jgi:hypothetical protein
MSDTEIQMAPDGVNRFVKVSDIMEGRVEFDDLNDTEKLLLESVEYGLTAASFVASVAMFDRDLEAEILDDEDTDPRKLAISVARLLASCFDTQEEVIEMCQDFVRKLDPGIAAKLDAEAEANGN